MVQRYRENDLFGVVLIEIKGLGHLSRLQHRTESRTTLHRARLRHVRRDWHSLSEVEVLCGLGETEELS